MNNHFSSSPEISKLAVDFVSCRARLLHLLDKYGRKGKFTYSIDELTGEARINIMIACKTFNFDASIFWLSAEKESEELADLKKHGFSYRRLQNCKRHGVTVKEIIFFLKYQAERDKYSPDTTELVGVIETTGYKKFFISMFKDLIPSQHIMGIKSKKEQLSQSATVLKLSTIPVERDYRELGIANRLAQRIGGLREQPTPSGNIDVLTPHMLIEVKCGENWKHGIGQLVAYGFHKPDRVKVLYLFDYEKLDLDNVRDVCRNANIEVMLEPQP